MSESDFKEEYLKAFGESLKKIRIESAKKVFGCLPTKLIFLVQL